MGRYINHNSSGTVLGSTYNEKLKGLKKDKAREIEEPMHFTDNLVLLGDNSSINMPWGFAAYMYSDEEFQTWKKIIGDREHVWLKYEHAKDTAR